jgi:hypothetical protein
MADTREIERDLRTGDALDELSGGSGRDGVDAEGGVYGAEGDDWVYKVGPDGSIMVKNTAAGGDWLPAPKAAEVTIQAQIDGGQLTQQGAALDVTSGGAEGLREAGSRDLARGRTAESANPFDMLDEESPMPEFDPQAIRMDAAGKALRESGNRQSTMGESYPPGKV